MSQNNAEASGSAYDRLAVLAALAAQQTPELGPAPSAEELAALTDGGLSGQARERVLAYLDASPTMMREWLAVSAVSTVEVTPANAVPGSVIPIPRRRRIQTLSGLGLALAASLLVALWWPWHQRAALPDLVDSAYELAMEAPGVDAGVLVALRLSWETDPLAYGFATSDKSPLAFRAFGTGLWEGRNRLRGTPVPADKPAFLMSTDSEAATDQWSFYSELGRWILLVDTVCKSTHRASDAFWREQPPIAEKIQAVLSQAAQESLEARLVLVEFRALAAVIQEIAQDSTSITRGCTQVDRHAARLTAHLAAGGGAR